MTTLRESDVEKPAIALPEQQGCSHIPPNGRPAKATDRIIQQAQLMMDEESLA